MPILTLDFYECENDGDADYYESDLRDSGAASITRNFNYANGSCEFTFEVNDNQTFWKAFEQTESYEFIN